MLSKPHPPDPWEATGTSEAIGQSEAFLVFEESLSRVAPIDRPVLIVGERGTGKEFAARRIHYLSGRWSQPLVALNCAALAPGVLESELFGHESGAFTGATGRRRGRFEAADGGTLFLDELGNLPLPVQEKLLRVVEYGTFERVGGTESVRVNVRLVGATNADLPALVDQGRFMRDLLDRLAFEVVHVPPLRERREDIPLLAAHFAGQMARELGRTAAPEFTAAVMTALLDYPWRGNIRELKNVVERAVCRCAGGKVTELVFDPFNRADGIVGDPRSNMPPALAEERDDKHRQSTPIPAEWRRLLDKLQDLPLREALETLEHHRVDRALAESRYHQRQAAARLGLSYDQFRGILRRLGK